MKFILVVFSIFLVLTNYAQVDSSQNSIEKSDDILNKEIPVLDFNSLAPLLETNSDKTYVINFWAMWCAPCVKELPIFQALKDKNNEIEVLLVSLDFVEDIETKLKPFLKKKGISLNVVLLDDPNSNEWIDKVNPNWSGSLPFTIIFDNQNRSYHEREFKDLEDLENEIKQTIKTK